MGVATTQGEVLPSGTFQIPGVRLGVCSVWVGIEQLDPMLPDAPLAGWRSGRGSSAGRGPSVSDDISAPGS
jgi:hypothetical protein